MNMKRMYKSGAKRVLSFALAVCMLLGIMPAGVVTVPDGVKAQAVSEVITYNFLNLNSGNAYFIVNNQVNAKFTNYDHVKDGDAKWKYYAHDAAKTSNNAFFQSNAYGLYMKSTADANYQLLLEFTGNGYFSVDAKIGDWAALTGATLSLIPCNENGGNQGAAIELGKIDGSSASGGKWNVPTHVGKVALTPGNYILNIFNDYDNKYDDTTVIGALSFTKLNLDVNVEPAAPVAIGKSVTTEVSLADPSDLATEIDCTAVSATSDIASFSLDDDGNLVVTAGNTAGSEVVAVTFTAGDKSETVKMPITVYDPMNYAAATYEYSFYKGNKWTDLAKTMKSYNQTSAGATGEIKTSIATYPWKFESSSVIFDFKTSYADSYGVYVYNQTGTAKVRFYLPSSGNYNLFSMSQTHSAYGSTVSFSLQRADGTGTYSENTVIGSINTKGSATARQTETFQIGSQSILLEAGEYILTYNIDAKNNYFFPAGFKLVGLGSTVLNASAASPTEEIKIGESVSLPLTLSTLDGTAVDYNALAISSVESSDGTMVNAELEKTADSASLKLTGARFGSTNLKVNLSMGDYTGSVSLRVVVRHSETSAPAAGDLYYDITKGYDPTDPTRNDNDYVPTITYNKTTNGAVGELNSSITSAPWAYFDRTPHVPAKGGNVYYKYYNANNGIYCVPYYVEDTPMTVQFKLQVPATGYYIPSVTINPIYDGSPVGTSSLYEYNAIDNTKGKEIIAPVEFPSGAGSPGVVTLSDIPILLEAGEYVMVFGASGNSTMKKGSLIKGYTLTYIGSKPVVFKATPESATATVVKDKSIDVPITITYTEDDVPVDFDYTNATVEFAYSTSGVAEATANKTADGISLSIAGKELGTTTVTTTVTAGNWKSSFNILVAVDDGKAKDLYFNFYKTFLKESAVDYLDGINSYEYTTEGSSLEKNKGSYPTAPWAVHSKTSDNYIKHNYENQAIAFHRKGTINFKLMVNAPGWYKPSVLFYRASGLGNMTAQLKKYNPSTNEIGEIIAASETAGATEIAVKAWSDLGDKAVYLESGEYILTVSQNTNASVLGYLDAFRLDAVKLMPEAAASIKVGETAEILAFRGAKFECDTLAATAANDGIVSVEVDKTSGIIKLNGIAAGETTLTVTAEGDLGGSYTIPVKVIDPENAKAKSVYYNFKKANTSTGDKLWAWTLLNSYNLTATGATDEANKDMTNSFNAANGTWKYFSVTGDTTKTWFYGYEGAGTGLSANTLMQTMVKIVVPETGMYQIIPVHSKLTNGATVKFTLYEISAQGIHGKATELGSINTQAAANENGVATALPSVAKLEAGEYILSMDLAKGSTKSVIDGILLKAPDVESSAQAVAVARDATITHPVDIESDADVVRANVSQSNQIADIATIIDNGELKLQIDGKINGETIVTYEAYMSDGSFGVGSFKLFVNPAGVVVADDLRFDYHKLSIYRNNGDTDDKHTGVDVTTVTDLSMTTEGSADEINPNSSVITEPWCYVSDTGSQLRYASYDYGMIFDYEPATMVFKIRVKNDGLYRPYSEHMLFNSGAKVKLWLAPDGVADTTADEYYLGEVDSYSDAQQTAVQQGLKIRQLTAGDYILTYKMEGKDEAVRSNGRFGVGAFILKGMGSHTVLTASVSGEDMIPVGVEKEFVVKAFETDGVDGHAASVDVSVEMSNPIVSYVVEQNAEKTETAIKITGSSAGNTVVKVTVLANGVEEVVTVPITVYDGNEVATGGTEYNYSFSKTLLGGMNVVEVDSFSKMMEGSPDEIRPNNGIDTHPWKFEFSQASAFYAPDGAQDKYGVCMGTGVGAAAGIRIRLPASGIFTPIVPFTSGNQCPTFRTYIAPADAEDPMAEEYSVGTWDAFAEEGKADQTAVFRSLYLEAGEYIVSWKILEEDENILESVKGKSRMWYSGIKLKAMDEYPEITVTADAALPDIKLGNSASVKLSATVADGAIEDFIASEFKVDEAYEDKVSANTVINSDGTASLEVTGLAVGRYDVGLTLMLNGAERAKFNIPVNVIAPAELASIQPKLYENEDNTIIRRATEDSLGHVVFDMVDVDGDEISELSATLQGAIYTYESQNEAVATVDADGVITPISDGKVTISCSVTIAGVTKYGDMLLTIVPGKARRSFYTEEKISAARENAGKYAWARSTVIAAENAAKKYLDKEEFLWNLVTTNELPRSYYVGYRADQKSGYCRYCGKNIEALTGVTYPWKVDPINSPWKVQCPACRRKFPSNDFESFYKLGIQDNGKWSYELAKAKNQELVDMGHGGYLVNIDHTEMGEGWGVDDGYGYDTGNIGENGVKEVHTYISYYNHWAIWHATGMVYTALESLRDAYMYTGDAKYGRVGAILLDRVADVYPEQDTRPYRWQLTADASYAPHGKSVDLIWENQNANGYCQAYDAFYPMYNDPQVISFLSRKAKQYGMENTKTTANMIRENIEDGIVRETYKAACEGSINGNFGMTQSAVAMAAVVLDTMPETRQWLDWVFQDGVQNILYPDSKQADLVTGGNVMRQIIDNVDRDGIADEVAPNYANIWIGGMTSLLASVEGYDGYPSSNLYNNSRFVKMLSGMHPLTMSRFSTVQIGDSGAVGGNERLVTPSRAQPAWKNTGKHEFAQMLYFINGNSTKNLRYDIFTKDPERLAKEVQQVIDTYGEYDFDKSEMLTGYGLASLRDGTSIASVSGEVDTQSTFWMSFARYSGHGHYDKLNLGIEAYGANIAPELGYPQKVIDDLYYNWGKATVAHNTVVVDDSHQNGLRKVANPLHFDDSGMVKVMDVEANDEYGKKVEKYRRSVVTVNINEESNYAVDFFRVKGGSEHVYSFHALSTEKPEIGVNGGDEIAPVPQKDGDAYVGTYAGRNVFFETENVKSGYSYLKNVDRAANPGNEVYVDFKIDNSIRKQISDDRDVSLKLTMLNNFDLSELALAEGVPAAAKGNPSHLEFMLARRSSANGESLDSLFTTVIEPYDAKSNISKMEQVTVTLPDGSPVDQACAKAVKVTLENERVDYIIYAEDNSVEYLVDGKIEFQGFVGVYSEKDGKNIYSYVNDGTKIGTLSGKAELNGTVSSYTEDLTDENIISVDFAGNEEINLESLAGKYVYIQGGVDGNAAYEIIGASDEDEDGIVDLDIGDITLIESLKSAENGVYTYNYNIAPSAEFRIPLATETDNSPIITPIADTSVTAGKKFTKTVTAVSPIDNAVTFHAVSLPRGASLNTETGVITWTPDEKQIGKNVISVRASDGALTSTLFFTVEVVRAAGDVSADDSASDNTGNEDTGTESGSGTDTGAGSGSGSGSGAGAGGGGGAAGGGASGGGSDNAPSGGESSDEDNTQGDTDSDAGEDIAERFVDLAGYDWAKDAINSLANDGVINGTSANTYSPGRDITRADFTVLLVRAFALESDSTENFADVSSNAYYAKELAIAKAHGIVNGVGNNKYNPTSTITRQDMITIVSRALDKLGYELNEAGTQALVGYADAAEVSEYAAEHAAKLIANEIVKGSNGRINPKSNTTRAEVAVLIMRLINLKK